MEMKGKGVRREFAEKFCPCERTSSHMTPCTWAVFSLLEEPTEKGGCQQEAQELC